MIIRKITRLGDPILRQRAREIPPQEIKSVEIQRLIDDLIETMDDAEGVGLAAPQVREGLRLFITSEIYDPADDEKILAPARIIINPELKFLDPEEVAYWEGCLSVPDLRGLVSRPRKLHLTGFDRAGKKLEFEAEDFVATVIQHEYDHLDGIVFLDRMPDMKTLSFIREFHRFVDPPPSAYAD